MRCIKGLRVWGMLFVVLLALMGITGCFGKLKEFEHQALTLDDAMHKKMAAGDVAGIYDNADQRYRDAVTREKSDAFYASIARKLGAPLDCKQGNTRYFVGTGGTTIASVCDMHFAKNASGVETFTWLKSGDTYKLLGYDIKSNDLIRRYVEPGRMPSHKMEE
jgi:hypothetical protein